MAARKKTTTGAMGSRRKTDTKQAKVEKADKPPEKAGRTKRGAKKAEPKAAKDVIPEVDIGLLATYPELPDREAILAQFADYYRESKERAEAAAQAALEADVAESTESVDESGYGQAYEPAPEVHEEVQAEPSERPRRLTRRPIFDTSAFAEPRPAVAEAPAAAEAAEAAAPVYETAAPSAEEMLADIAPMAEVVSDEPVPAHAASEDDSSPESTGASNDESIWGSLEPPPEPEDLFALLKSDAPAEPEPEDLDFTYQTDADQSSPFVVPSGEDVGATRIGEAVAADDGVLMTPVAQEALPARLGLGDAELIGTDDSTKMIMAMPDDDDETEEAAPKPARKSRKSTRKRKG